jgi:ectoine hydroxylase-related dioxygenase (phytanoyl-CoA dioxygenase family)
MHEDGYLFLPGCLSRDDVKAARAEVLRRMNANGSLDPAYPIDEGVLSKDPSSYYFREELAYDNPQIEKVVYDGAMMAILGRLLGAPVRHFDFTWFRAVGHGNSTAPHCDLVYMGRGTHELYTAWTPMGDIDLEMGGLIVLENSHRRTDITGEYLQQDVDTYCENGPNAEAVRTGKIHWEHWQDWQREGAAWDGAFSDHPPQLREELGTRWLTAPEYRMGDVLIFSMRTLHASLQNQTNRVRLSTDTRYQRADAPVDERWVNGANGERPPAHGTTVKRGRIC